MAQCTVTVLKCTLDEELKAKYIPDPDYGLCPYFQPGQVFVSREGERPEAFSCRIGWRALEEEVRMMTSPEPGPFAETGHVVCCNDGCRPVIFLLEREE